MTIKEIVLHIKAYAIIQNTTAVTQLDFIIWMGVKNLDLSIKDILLLHQIEDCELRQIAEQAFLERKKPSL